MISLPVPQDSAATVRARGQGAIGDDRDGGTRAHGAGRNGAGTTWRDDTAQAPSGRRTCRRTSRRMSVCRATKRLRRAARGARCCVVPAPSPSAPPWSGRLPASVRPRWPAPREHRAPGAAANVPVTPPIPLSPRLPLTPPTPVIPPNRRARHAPPAPTPGEHHRNRGESTGATTGTLPRTGTDPRSLLLAAGGTLAVGSAIVAIVQDPDPARDQTLTLRGRADATRQG